MNIGARTPRKNQENVSLITDPSLEAGVTNCPEQNFVRRKGADSSDVIREKRKKERIQMTLQLTRETHGLRTEVTEGTGVQRIRKPRSVWLSDNPTHISIPR